MGPFLGAFIIGTMDIFPGFREEIQDRKQAAESLACKIHATSLEKKLGFNKCHPMGHVLHVWNIYLHLP